ncbi:hypothetical protein JOD21_002400 [Jeotgalibacillus terrae]|nr:hypothetical protein [Jeotgalibacillus terrae]
MIVQRAVLLVGGIGLFTRYGEVEAISSELSGFSFEL